MTRRETGAGRQLRQLQQAEYRCMFIDCTINQFTVTVLKAHVRLFC